MTANGGLADEVARLSKELRDRDKEYKQVKKELARKESALAETAALLVLRKRCMRSGGKTRKNDQHP